MFAKQLFDNDTWLLNQAHASYTRVEALTRSYNRRAPTASMFDGQTQVGIDALYYASMRAELYHRWGYSLARYWEAHCGMFGGESKTPPHYDDRYWIAHDRIPARDGWGTLGGEAHPMSRLGDLLRR